MQQPWSSSPLLALDTTSPLLSVAVGSMAATASRRSEPATRSSAAVMRLLSECLDSAQVRPADLTGVLLLRGPGSFTGIRVGLALAQGLHQALAVPVGTLTTFEALAAADCDADRPLVAVVPSGRGSWQVQHFGVGDIRKPTAPPQRLSDDDLRDLGAEARLVGFGRDRCEGMDGLRWSTPQPLAPLLLRLADQAHWDAAGLGEPLYLAPPPADPSALRRG